MREFPRSRPRRLRQAPWIREIVRETRLVPANLIQPFFVIEGTNTVEAIESMPGISRLSIDQLLIQVRRAYTLGIRMVALFPKLDPGLKSLWAEEAYNQDNLMARAIMAIKKEVPEIGVMGDVALDSYTTHGHDGLMVDGAIDNDKTLEVLCKQALTLAAAGCDVIAPSEMMDGRIGVIRDTLEANGFKNIIIISYAAKYATFFYGPFRDAVGSRSNLGKADKGSYQMDIANGVEAMREVALDIAEGADMVIIKPGLPYLDVIARVRDRFDVPIVAYQVSGEYSMLLAAAKSGYLEYDDALYEALIALRRAGADSIITYAAMYFAEKLYGR